MPRKELYGELPTGMDVDGEQDINNNQVQDVFMVDYSKLTFEDDASLG